MSFRKQVSFNNGLDTSIGTVSNLFTTNITSTNIRVTNETATNLFVTNFTVSNFNVSSSTIGSIYSANIKTTNLTAGTILLTTLSAGSGIATLGTLVSNNVKTTALTAGTILLTTLSAGSATATLGTLVSGNVNATALTAGTVLLNTLSAGSAIATLGTLVSGNVNATALTAGTVLLNTLSAGSATATLGTLVSGNVNATALTAGTVLLTILSAGSATATLGTLVSTNASATNLAFTTLSAGSATATLGTLVSGNVNATALTAGTVLLNTLSAGSATATLGTLVSSNVNTTALTAGTVLLNTLSAGSAIATLGTLVSTNASATNLALTTLSAGSATATLGNLVSGNVNTTALTAGTVLLTTLSAGSATATLGNLVSGNVNTTALTAGTVLLTTLSAGSATATLGTLVSGNVNTTALTAGTVLLTTLSAGSANATLGSLVSDNVNATALTAGTVLLTTLSAGSANATLGTLVSGNVNTTALTAGTVLLTTLSAGSATATLGNLVSGNVNTTALTAGTVLLTTLSAGSATATLGNLVSGNVNTTALTAGTVLLTTLSAGSATATLGTLVSGNVNTTALTAGTVLLTTLSAGSATGTLGSLVSGNVNTTALTAGTVLLTTLSAGSATGTLGSLVSSNVNTTALTAGTVLLTTLSAGSATGTLGNLVSGNVNTTALTAGTVLATNISSTNITVTNLSSTSITSTNLNSTNISATSLTATTALLTNVSVANLTAGTLVSTNVSTTSLTATNILATNETITGALIAIGNSNTIGSVFTTGGNVGIGTVNPSGASLAVVATSTQGNIILGQEIQNKKIVLFHQFYNEHDYYGFGINSFAMRYQVANTASAHRFYASTSATSSNELLSVLGTGNVGVNISSPSYRLDVNGDVRITNGSLLVSSISAGGATASIGTVVATNGTISSLFATDSSATNLSFSAVSAGSATATIGNIISNNINVTSLTAGSEIVTNLSATNLAFTAVSAGSATATIGTIISNNLSAGTLAFTTLSAGSATATIGTILSTNISASNITVTNLVALNETVVNLTVTNETVQNLLIAEDLLVTDLSSSNATVTSALITNLSATNLAFTTVSAGSATATIGNIIANNINVTSLTTGSEVATNLSATNLAFTAVSAGSATATIGTVVSTDLFATNATVSSLFATGASATNLAFTTVSAGSATATIGTVISTNISATNATVSSLFATGASATNLALLSELSAGSATATIGTIVSNNINVTALTVGSELVTNLSATNITTTNILITHGTVTGDLLITGNSLKAISNSNTVGAIFTTGGNVGIANTAPNYRLDVNGDINFTGDLYENGSLFTTSQWTGSVGSALSYTSGTVIMTDTSVSNITVTNVLATNVTITGGLTATASANTVGAIITTGGSVGIGITPSQKLHLYDANTGSTLILAGFASGESNNGIWFHLDDNLGLNRVKSKILAVGNGSYGRSNLHFCLNGSNDGNSASLLDTRLIIQDSGNVGIGTSSPSQIFQVGDAARLRISNDATDYSLIGTKTTDDSNNTRIVISGQQRSGNAGHIEYVATTTGSHIFYNQGGNVTAMTIVSSGNVGIGTTSPIASLEVSTSNTFGQLFLGNAIQNRKLILYSTVNNDHEYYGLGIQGETLRYQVDQPNSSHIFYAAINATSSKELMRIRGDGNVGIGTTAPSFNLTVNGTIGSNSITTGALAATNISVTNLVATNETVVNLTVTNETVQNLIIADDLLVTDLSASNATVTNALITNLSATNLAFTAVSAGSATATIGTVVSSNINVTSLTVGSELVTNLSATNLAFTAVSAGSATATIGTVVSSNLNVTALTSSTALITNMSSTNITTTNILITHGTVTGDLLITGNSLKAISNSNTVGAIFTTGGNVGINNTAPNYRLDVNGDINFTGDLYENGSLFTTSQWTGSVGSALSYTSGTVIMTNTSISNLTVTNILATNETITGGLLITGGSLKATANDNTVGPIITTFTTTTFANLVPVTSGLLAYYNGSSWTGSQWSDLTTNGNNATVISGTINTTTENSVTYLYGDTNAYINFPAGILPTTYTLFHVTKYNGASKQRIICDDNTNPNWLSGFWSGKSEVVYHDGDAIGSNGNLGFGVSNSTNWVLSTDKRTSYRANGNFTATISNGANANVLTVNGSNERSDWAVSEIIVYNRELTTDEVERTESWLMDKYSAFTFTTAVTYPSAYTAGSVSVGTYGNIGLFVGISNTAPSYTLDVNGDINFTGDLYENGSLFTTSQWTGSVGSALSYTSGTVIITNSSIQNMTATNILTTNLSTGTIRNVNEIAVGQEINSFTVPTPLAPLDVVAKSSKNNAVAAFQYPNGGGFRHWVTSRFNTGSNNGNAIDFYLNTGNDNADSSTPGTGNQHVMTIAGLGVGIGNTAPSYTLDVNGTIGANSITTGQLAATNISVTNLVATNETVVNLVTTYETVTNLLIADDIRVTDLTSSNSNLTAITAGGITVSSGGLNATFNSNTIGPIVTTGGNVGIGNTAPSYDLDVTGDINFTGDLYENGSLFTTSQWTGSIGSTISYTSGNVNVVNATFTTTGNVGIGNTAPSYDLDVTGDINFTGDLYKNGTIIGLNPSYITRSAQTVASQTISAGSNILFFPDAGQTTNDITYNTSGTFTVNKDGLYSVFVDVDTYNADDVVDLYILKNNTEDAVNGRIAWVNNSGDDAVSINAMVYLAENDYITVVLNNNATSGSFTTPYAGSKVNSFAMSLLNVGSTTVRNSQWIGNIGSDVSYTSGNVLMNDVTVSNILITNATVTGTILILGNSLKAVSNSNTVGAIITTGGNVGIGTTAPSFNLTVNGTIGANSITTGALAATNISVANLVATNETVVNLVTTFETVTNLLIADDIRVTDLTSSNSNLTSVTAGGITVTSGGLRATFNSNTLGNIITTGGNVGIGLTNPLDPLEVRNAIGINTSDSTGALRIASSGDINYIQSGQNLTSNSRRPLRFTSMYAGTTYMTLDTSGNLGIGTVTPNGMLHTYNTTNGISGLTLEGGYENFSTQPFIRFGAPAIASATNGYAFISTELTGTGAAGQGGILRLFTKIANTANYSGVSINQGNVGIGTTSPSFLLDVNGTFEASNTSGVLCFASTGNVGIGTTTPSQMLEVVGTLGLNTNNSTGALRLTSFGDINYIQSGQNFTSDSRRPLRFTSMFAGSTFMTLDTGGNVGIGTTSPSTRLQVDGVVKSTVPSWNAYKISHTTVTAGATVTYNNERITAQNCTFSQSTGILTATVAGRYFVFFHGFSEADSNSATEIELIKNSSTYIRTYGNKSSGVYETGYTLNAIVDLAVNDTLSVKVVVGSLHGNANCSFGGYLIG